jgi:hypothetical protein
MRLSKLLKLQVIYMLLGVGYNIVSAIWNTYTGETLSTTSPALGISTMLIYGLCLLSGHFGYLKVYRSLMLVAIIGFGYAGILLHVFNFTELHLYHSLGAYLLAIGINVFGLYPNIIALTGKFVHEQPLAF